jgi:Transmembrane adaptor Erv26
MWILPLLGYLGLVLGFCFLTLSIASGLYYLSELVEEHTVLSARLLRNLIYSIIGVQTLLWLVDGFPFILTALGIASHAVYASNLRHFPIVKLGDPLFILSCVLVLINHWVWFRHFSQPAPFKGGSRSRLENGFGDKYQTPVPQPSFTEIASYFGLCVWLVPFALFVSLSAGENVLPSMGSEYATGERKEVMGQRRKRRNTGMAKAAVAGVREWVGETGAVVGLWHGENVRRFD